jgi:hypothetical protein
MDHLLLLLQTIFIILSIIDKLIQLNKEIRMKEKLDKNSRFDFYHKIIMCNSKNSNINVSMTRDDINNINEEQ